MKVFERLLHIGFSLTLVGWASSTSAQLDQSSAKLETLIRTACQVQAWQFQLRSSGKSTFSLDISPTLPADQRECIFGIIRNSGINIPSFGARPRDK